MTHDEAKQFASEWVEAWNRHDIDAVLAHYTDDFEMTTPKRLLADVREVTKLPILWVVNTHYHLDHAWGNCVFEAEGAKIVGASPAPKLLAERGAYGLAHADQHGLKQEDVEGTTLAPATVSFTGTMSIDLGGVLVELRSLPHGHSPDNLLVWVAQDKTLFGGDLLFVGCHPFIGESDIPGWRADLDAIASLGAEKIVPGHELK